MPTEPNRRHRHGAAARGARGLPPDAIDLLNGIRLTPMMSGRGGGAEVDDPTATLLHNPGEARVPVAWVEAGGVSQDFTVITGVVVNGEFAATDHTFDIQDACS